jgi:hypothetical protein
MHKAPNIMETRDRLLNWPADDELTRIVSSTVWVRVEAFHALDRDLEALEDALRTVHRFHEKIARQIREELSGSYGLARAVRPDQPRLMRSFDYYLRQLVSMVTARRS